MNIVVFEDAGVEKLFPITTGRPAYAISCASYRLVDWLNLFDGNLTGVVRPYLESIQLLDFPELESKPDAGLQWTLVVNARMAPTASNYARLQKLMSGASLKEPSIDKRAIVVRSDWAIAAAIVPTSFFSGASRKQIASLIDQIPSIEDIQSTESEFELFNYGHDVIGQNMSQFGENLSHRLEHRSYKEIQDGVFVGSDVQLNDHLVFDTSSGPVVFDDHVKVGPFGFFRGPVYIGPRSKVSEHASVKDAVSIAHTCKIGGEVEGVVFEPYSNKQHHGFLGHSYVGSWINLGAGTCNSDLKNTYGIVNMVYGDEKVSTGMQFVGCIIGDYAKTAINTCIFTGKLIGTAAMVYGFATTNVPSFVNYARTFDAIGVLPPEIVATTQKRMFARRDVPQRPCDIQLVHDMFESTQNERPDDLSRTPISL